MKLVRHALFTLALMSWVPAGAAVTPVGTPSSDAGNSATASTSITVASGTDLAYICIFGGGGATISSIGNFGGVAPALVGSNDSIHLYRVVSPASGSTTAQANLSASLLWAIHVITLDGVDTADPDDTAVTNGNSEAANLSATVSSATGDLVIACGLMISDTIAAFDGATLSTEEEAIDGSFSSTAMIYEAGAASVTLGVTWTEPSFGDNLIIATNVNAAGGGGGALLLRRRRG